jgi:hypothetical protein
MADPVGFILLLAVGAFGIAVGVVGLRRGKAVALVEPLRVARADRPFLFWYGVGFQLLIGAVCLITAVVKAFE